MTMAARRHGRFVGDGTNLVRSGLGTGRLRPHQFVTSQPTAGTRQSNGSGTLFIAASGTVIVTHIGPPTNQVCKQAETVAR